MADTIAPPPVQVEPPPKLRWYQGVPRYAWIVFLIATLGWLFDAMDQNLYNLVRQPSITELVTEVVNKTGLSGKALADAIDAAVKATSGNITSIFLIGWACGGLFFGVVGDKLGRTRTMIITIMIYALFTGLSGLARTPFEYGLCRFLTALGVGGEFAAGAALVAEVWPDRSRPMALGMLQALSAVGNMTAAIVVFTLAGVSWRWVYVVGAVPALLVVWIRTSVKEPKKWEEARAAAEEDGKAQELGRMSELFTNPVLRKNTIAGVLIAAAGVGGLWGIGFFLPDLVGTVLAPLVKNLGKAEAASQLARWRSEAFFIQQIGAFLGMLSYAALSERTGRKPALLLFLLLAWVAVVGTFWSVTSLLTACICSFFLGFCTLAPFSAFAVYFPELYPTRLRATGVGVCYNCARLVAAAAPFALGGLMAHFADPMDKTHGMRVAATIVSCIYAVGFLGLIFAPETRGKPLPE